MAACEKKEGQQEIATLTKNASTSPGAFFIHGRQLSDQPTVFDATT